METFGVLFSSVKWWMVGIVFLVSYFAVSLKIVYETERGLSILWGHILKELESGPHFVPWPMRLVKVTKNAIKVDFGTLDEAEEIERAMKSEPYENWFVMKEPVRINWGDLASSSGLSEDEKKGYENDNFASRLTTDPHLYFIFQVFSLRNLVEVAGGLDEAIDRIKDTCITALQEMAGETFVAKAIKEIGPLSDKIREEVEWLVGDPNAKERKGQTPNRSWGIDVVEVRIKSLGTPHRTNEAIANRSAAVANARGEATSIILKAGAEKTRLTQEGEGRAAARTAEGKAEASAIRAQARAVNAKGGELVAKLHALETGLEYGKTVILPSDMSLLTTATSLKAAIDAVSKEKEK